MLVAKVKLPVAIKRDMFTKLSEEFQCIQENKDSRVYDDTTYDYALDKSIECVTVMNKNEFYIDECEKKMGNIIEMVINFQNIVCIKDQLMIMQY